VGFVIGSLVLGLIGGLGWGAYLACELMSAFFLRLSEAQSNVYSLVLFGLLCVVGIGKPLGDAVVEWREEKRRI
jgi:hypothetical protein